MKKLVSLLVLALLTALLLSGCTWRDTVQPYLASWLEAHRSQPVSVPAGNSGNNEIAFNPAAPVDPAPGETETYQGDVGGSANETEMNQPDPEPAPEPAPEPDPEPEPEPEPEPDLGAWSPSV